MARGGGSARKTRGTGGNGSAKTNRRHTPVAVQEPDASEDEVEAFHRRKIESLDARELDSDSGSDGDEDEMFSEDDREVLGLKGSDDDGDSDVDDDSEEDAEDEDGGEGSRKAKHKQNSKRRQQGSNDDDDGGDDESGGDDSDGSDVLARIGKQWGNTAASFYKQGDESDDQGGDSDDEVNEAEAEEQEAVRLQREQALAVSADDFALDGMSSAKKKKKRDKNKSKNTKDDSENDNVVTLSRGRNDADDATAMQRVAADAPELVALLGEFKDKSKQLESFVGPILERLQNGKLATQQGVTYLEAKLHVLLSYCINISFYLLLKAEGQSVREHPVISQLVRCRTIMEKLRPLDGQLKQQLDSLMRQSDGGVASSATGATKSQRKSAARAGSQAGPSIGDLEGESEDEDGVDDFEDEDDGDDEDEFTARARDGKEGVVGGKYVVPKMSAMPFEEEERLAAKRDKAEEKRRRKLKQSRMLADLRQEFSSRPMEEAGVGAEHDDDGDIRKEDAERQKYEEENFVRLVETKKDRKRRQRREHQVQQGMMNSMAELEDLQGLEALVSAGSRRRDANPGLGLGLTATSHGDGADVDMEARRGNSLTVRKRDVNQFVSSLESKARKGKRVRTGDEDLPIVDPEERARNRQASQFDRDQAQEDQNDMMELITGSGGSRNKHKGKNSGAEEAIDYDAISGDEFYEQAKRIAKSKKSKHREKYAMPERDAPEPVELLRDGNKKRAASHRILKNKGLHAHKKKEERNPRVKLRKKFEKKLKSRKGQVREIRTGEAHNYAGETTGLRTNIVRSRKPGQL